MVEMPNIFSLTSMPSATTVLSTYSTFAASAMLVRTVFSEIQTTVTQIIPPKIREKILSKIGSLLGNPSSQITIIFDDYDGYVVNQMYEACIKMSIDKHSFWSDAFNSFTLTSSVRPTLEIWCLTRRRFG